MGYLPNRPKRTPCRILCAPIPDQAGQAPPGILPLAVRSWRRVAQYPPAAHVDGEARVEEAAAGYIPDPHWAMDIARCHMPGVQAGVLLKKTTSPKNWEVTLKMDGPCDGLDTLHALILRKQPVARAIWPSTSALLHGIRLWWLSDAWGIAFFPNVGGAPCAAIPLPKKGSGASSWLVPRLCRGEGGGHVANAMSLPSEPPESRHTVPLPPSRIRLDARSGQTRIWSPGRTGCGGMAAGAEPTELTGGRPVTTRETGTWDCGRPIPDQAQFPEAWSTCHWAVLGGASLAWIAHAFRRENA